MAITAFENYNRRAACCNLEEFDLIFADETDFIEACEWKNGQGVDITINDDTHFSITYGELDAINYLVSQLLKE